LEKENELEIIQKQFENAQKAVDKVGLRL